MGMDWHGQIPTRFPVPLDVSTEVPAEILDRLFFLGISGEFSQEYDGADELSRTRTDYCYGS